MTNRLFRENSPYLLQHAENPVDWYPWGKEAFDKARAENKPIFLSIGYSACHWCHVMAHESFEDGDTAAILNQHFISIKVDREERPDIDGVYMTAVVAMTGQGGWPMSVFLTPDGSPFYGGTYFPPTKRFNMPSFKEVLLTISQLWKEDRARLFESADRISEYIQNSQIQTFDFQPLEPAILDQASLRLAQSYDWQNGGWGNAPKFPQPMAIMFLIRRATRGDQMALDVARHALDAMSKGGMYDVIGGGFARYSTDNNWLTPHFEKMLYDNAQLARAYLHGYLVTGDVQYRRVCEATLDFIRRELMLSTDQNNNSGYAFFSSLDADSEGVEGKYYIWQWNELLDILEESRKKINISENIDLMDFISSAYHLSPKGNFEGQIILQRAAKDEELSRMFHVSVERVSEILGLIHDELFLARQKRVRPGTDDKILVAWNALTLIAFSEAGRYLKRQDYIETARKNAIFLLSELQINDRLYRSWRNGQAQHFAYLEDYAALVQGLLSLYQSDPNVEWFKQARKLTNDMISAFQDTHSGGFFDTRHDHEDLLVRPKDIQDNATPSGNALAAHALLQLFSFTGDNSYREIAERMLGSIQTTAVRYPTAFAEWLCALDFAQGEITEVALLGDLSQPGMDNLIDALWSAYRPRCVVAISSYPPDRDAPEILMNRPLMNGEPTAYVCQQFICREPVNQVGQLLGLLEQ